MKRLLMGGIAFVMALTLVVSGSLVAQEEAGKKKLLKLELPSLKLRKPACCETDAERAVCPKCSKKSTNVVAKLRSISIGKSCPDCSRKDLCEKCLAAAAEKKDGAVAKVVDTAEGVVEKTTDKVKNAVSKLRDRVKREKDDK